MYRSTFVLTCALFLAADALTSATVFLPADFTTVVEQSQTIAHGRVLSVQSAMTGPSRRIESVVTLSVIDGIKGVGGSTVSFRVPNGRVGRYRWIVVGAPEFAEGDEVVVFLQGRAPAMPSIFGLSQGVYRVTHDGRGEALVSRPPINASEARLVRGDPARTPLALDAFLRGIHTILDNAQ
jgi:hypothetical protein